MFEETPRVQTSDVPPYHFYSLRCCELITRLPSFDSICIIVCKLLDLIALIRLSGMVNRHDLTCWDKRSSEMVLSEVTKLPPVYGVLQTGYLTWE